MLSLADIVGSKWGMLDDRDEPRDLFDIWYALTQAREPFEVIAKGYRARYRHDPLVGFLTRAERLRGAWQERLAHQMKDLPSFDDVMRDVRLLVEEWEVGHG